MKTFSDPRFLVIYSGVVTIAFAVTLLCAFATTRNANFDILTVHRIDFVEPDGTPRLISSNRESFPGAYMRKKNARVRIAVMPLECFSSTTKARKWAA